MSQNTPSTRKPDAKPLQVNTHTCPISRSVSLRAYASTKPLNGKIADLQKGLILIIDGAEAVGEGTGFGLPVLVYPDETYFSGTSTVHVSQRTGGCTIRKEFMMDRIARNRFRNVTLENRSARTLITHLSDLYQKHRRFRALTLKNLTGKMSIGKAFPEASPTGKITVTYTIDESHITVKADFKNLKKKGLEKLFMLNEQSSRLFRKYDDAHGTELTDKKIGAWDAVNVEWASLKTSKGELGFRLWGVKDAVLRRGQEFLEGSLDWAGLDYEISREIDVFEYAVDVLGV